VTSVSGIRGGAVALPDPAGRPLGLVSVLAGSALMLAGFGGGGAVVLLAGLCT
jgi:hypothetical protein